ncbi:hypothetical protein PLESTB_001737400 [Pleodorina starrii]|uniref:Uncharacterized protein n=1 Tax=Pleodorina starrii TaxID=330485 RepID=A0A9W6C011_9CHLO|nr:hypothetical protein PLESTM_000745600 [Pleodorina starrii]GLC61264.1 hypothetical protein PLESTB_001737400 [Pleodorina starrii]GLC74730.1 hypothetical protein PLESTF_001549200 [Pleodorina starrii]
MSLSAVSSVAGRQIVASIAQAAGAISGRSFATAANQTPSSSKRKSSIVEPTYTYMPPGSSMREPLYFSMSDPVYFVDPKPDSQAAAAAQTGESKAAPQDVHAPTSVRKIDFSAIAGKHGDDGRPVSYRMADDMAQQGYVVNPSTHSMREPKYVSISEPKYPAAEKK